MATLETASDGRTRIVDAATRLFLTQGYKATSLKQIAQAVGVTAPSLYWHFESKRDIFVAVMEDLLDRWIHLVETGVDGATALLRLQQVVRIHVRFQLEESGIAGGYASVVGTRDLVEGLPRPARKRIVAKQERYRDFVRNIIRDGVASGEFAVDNVLVAAAAIHTMCEYVYAWFDPKGDLSPEQVAEYYAGFAASIVRAS